MRKELLQKKLKDRNGASILVALFVLLVCAIISSIVVTAGLSSAGRITNVAKTDQRYYSVTSAANLIRETLEGKPVVIVRTKDGDDYTCKFKDDEQTVSKGTGLFNDIAIDLVLNGNVTPGSENYAANVNTYVQPASYTPKTIKLSTNTTGINLLEVTAIIGLTEDGELEMTIYDGDGGKEHYNLKYTFSSDVHELEDINDDLGIITKTTTLNWILRTVEKI